MKGVHEGRLLTRLMSKIGNRQKHVLDSCIEVVIPFLVVVTYAVFPS